VVTRLLLLSSVSPEGAARSGAPATRCVALPRQNARAPQASPLDDPSPRVCACPACLPVVVVEWSGGLACCPVIPVPRAAPGEETGAPRAPFRRVQATRAGRSPWWLGSPSPSSGRRGRPVLAASVIRPSSAVRAAPRDRGDQALAAGDPGCGQRSAGRRAGAPRTRITGTDEPNGQHSCSPMWCRRGGCAPLLRVDFLD